MVETVAALLFLTPLFAAVVVLPRWHAAAADAQEAARNAAFADVPLRSIATLRSATARQALPDVAAGVMTAVRRELQLAQSISRGTYNFGEPDFRDVVVRAAETNLGTRFEIPGRLVLLRDDTSSLRRAEVMQRTTPLTPTAGLRAVRALISVERAAFATIEPSFRLLCIGGLDPDIVPADRMPGSVVPNRLPNFGRCD